MPEHDIAGTVAEVMAAVLQRPVEPGADLRREYEPRWDSLKHVEMIFALEDAFGIRMTEDEIGRLASASDIVAAIRSKRAP